MNYFNDHDLTDTNGDGFTDDIYSFGISNSDDKPLAAPYSFSNPEILAPQDGDTVHDIVLIEWNQAIDSLDIPITYDLVLIERDEFTIETIVENTNDRLPTAQSSFNKPNAFIKSMLEPLLFMIPPL